METHPYAVQGIPVLELCREFGTPLYVYDASVILRQLERFRSAFAGLEPRIRYAAKALTNLGVLRFMRRQGVGLDAVSIQEVQLGLRAGFPPQAILFTPNCVAFEEIEHGVRLGVSVTLENLPHLESFGERYGGSVPCCIRLHPDVLAARGAVEVLEWIERSKFGIPVSQLSELESVVERYGILVNGLHVHSSSRILDEDVYLQVAQVLFEVAKRFPRLDLVDLGGGIRVPHRAEDERLDLEALGVRLGESFRDFCLEYGRPLELWFEPGRFLVSDCGLLLARVDLVKSNGRVEFAGVDSGFNHLLRPMLYGAYHAIVNVSNPGGARRRYTVVGNICEQDEFGRDRELAEVRAGDVLAVLNAGAYGFSMSSNYNARPRPAEVLVVDGEPELVRRRETLEDLLRNQIEP